MTVFLYSKLGLARKSCGSVTKGIAVKEARRFTKRRISPPSYAGGYGVLSDESQRTQGAALRHGSPEVRQVFFCGGDKDEFDQWKRGLSDLAKTATKKKAEQTLKIEIDDEAFTRIYGHQSHPFPVKKGQKIAVRVISQFGEETTKVLDVP